MTTMKQYKSLSSNESGFASIVIALVLVLVMSLITIGFAQFARREQQNALNKQLSNQAYYAAETGVNDVLKLLKEGRVSDSANSCLTFPAPAAGGRPAVSNVLKPGVKYACATLSTKLEKLVKDPLAPDTAWTTIFSTPSGLPALSSLNIGWKPTDDTGKVLRAATNSGFSQSVGASPWKSPAVLQVSITPLVNTTRADLINNTFTVYLYPAAVGSPATVNYNSSGGTAIVSGCTAGDVNSCNVTITGLQAGTGSTPGASFLVHILTYYDASEVTISDGLSIGVSPSHLTFDGAQAKIDVTGKSREVLKRIRATVPLTGTNADAMSNFALEAQDVCKRFKTVPTPGTTKFIGTSDSDTAAGPANTPSCVLSP